MLHQNQNQEIKRPSNSNIDSSKDQNTTTSKTKTGQHHESAVPTFSMILFETSSSVFELLWDIALALFIFRISLVYFFLTYLSTLFASYFYTHTLSPLSLTSPPSPLFLLFYILLITLWARFTIVIYEVPRVKGFRIAIGAMAVIYAVVTEFLVGLVGYEIGGVKRMMDWGFEKGFWEALEGLGVLGAMVVMPLLLMVFETETDEMGEEVKERKSRHGHEGKRFLDAVPTVAISGKEKIGNGKKTN